MGATGSYSNLCSDDEAGRTREATQVGVPTCATRRPFDARIVKQTADLARRYRVIVRWDEADKGYGGECLEMPNAVGFGETECIAETRGNLTAIVSYMLETGETPPLAGEPKRTARVTVSFADYEKAAAQTLADAAGQSLPDYLRSAALRGR